MLLWCGFAHAQQMVISPEINEPGFDHCKVIGQDAEGYFVLISNLNLSNPRDKVGFKSRKTKLLYFNTELKLQWSVPFKPYPEDADLEAFGFFNGRAVIVGSITDRSSGKVTLYGRSYDNTGTAHDRKEALAVFQVDGERDKTILLASRDRKRVAIVMHSNIHVVKTATQADYIAVYDTAYNLLEQKIIHQPYSEKLYSPAGYALSGKGDVVALGVKSDKPKGKRDFTYEARLSAAGDTSVKTMVIGQGKRVESLGVEFDDVNRRAVFAGFYDAAGAGIIYASAGIEPGDQLQVSAKPIDPARNMKLAGKKYSRSGLSFSSFPIERIILRNNGGAVLVTESAYTSEYSYYDYFMQTFTNRVEYHFEEIMIISIDRNGEAEWSTVIDKEQVSMDDGGYFSSFTSLLNSEELIVLFNDDISRDNQVLAVKVDKTGLPAQSIAAKKDAKMLLIPRAGKQVSMNEILVPAYQKKSLVLVKFGFE